jgi:hypothetical protein
MQNVPWGLSDLSCSVPKYKRVSGKIILGVCGRILGEAKSPEEAKRVNRSCDACETTAIEVVESKYPAGKAAPGEMLAVHVLNSMMFRGMRIATAFAKNYGYLRDLDAFRRWWSTNVHPHTNGELGLEKFLRDVRFLYNRMQESSIVKDFVPAVQEPTPAEIEAALGIAPEEASFEPSPQEISATLPGGGVNTDEAEAPQVPDFDEESEKQRKARRAGGKGKKGKAAKPADTGAPSTAEAAPEEVTEVPKKGIKVMRVAGGDQEEGQ